MVLKTTLIVLGVFLALLLLGVGVMAALGKTIYIDFSSPGPIGGTARPQLEVRQDSNQVQQNSFFRVDEAPKFRFAD